MADVIDDSEQFFINFSEIPEKKFPWWILFAPLLLIPFLKRKFK